MDGHFIADVQKFIFERPALQIMIHYRHLAVFLCFIFSGLSAQQTVIDSLKAEIEAAEYDTTKISLWIDLAYEIQDSTSLDAARKAYQLSKSISYPKYIARSEAVYGLFLAEHDLDSGITLINRGANRYLENDFTERAANALYIKGIVNEVYGTSDTATSAYEQSIALAEEYEHFLELGNSAYSLANMYNIRGQNVKALEWAHKAKNAYESGSHQKKIGQSLNLIGIIYDQSGLYSEALDSYLKAREIAIQTDDIDNEILISNNMGVIYDEMNNTQKSMEYYGDALEKARINNMDENEATLLNNLSYIHLKNGDTARAIDFLKRSLQIDLTDTYPCFESYPLEGLGAVYIALDKLDTAEVVLNQALSTGEMCEDAAILTAVHKDLGMLHSAKGNLPRAEEAFAKSLTISKASNMKNETKGTLYELYKFHKRYNNTSEAMKYLEAYQSLVDSLYEAKNVEKATQLASEYEFRKQVAKMEQERMESEKKFADEIQAKTYQNRLIMLALLLFFLLAATLGRSYYIIQKRNKKLRWLNDEKNKLMGIVAHDLRNPLNMIIGLMPLFQDVVAKSKDKNLEKYVELLETSSERMRDMIDRVLDISAIENMKVNLKLEKTNLTDLTYSSIHNFDVIASQKQIAIIDNIDKSDERFANVDPNYLVQVIDNLLSNAIKFSDRGKQIEVSLLSENNHHEIVVKDQGPGISEDEQKNLFKAYTTLSSKPTEQERSTGLGLSIAYKFVKAMGGEIKCQSKPGEGTTFNLKFEKA